MARLELLKVAKEAKYVQKGQIVSDDMFVCAKKLDVVVHNR